VHADCPSSSPHRAGATYASAGYTPASTMWPWFDRTIASLESTLDLGYRYDTARS
jgi:hypothetical protein